MPSDSFTERPDEGLPKKVNESLRRLGDAFRVPFDLWAYKNGFWSCRGNNALQNDAQSSIGENELADILQNEQQNEPLVKPLQDDRNLAIVPLGQHEQTSYAAVALVPGQDAGLLENLASSVLLTVKQKNELEIQANRIAQFVSQVSSDFEELSWLRKLAERLEYNDATKKIANVANHVLPALAEVIKAEAVVLFAISESQQATDRQSQVVGRPWFSSDEDKISADVCRYLVEQYGERAAIQPIVNNQLSEDDQFLAPFGLRSFILVPVAKAGIQFGWLLAFNKLSPSGSKNDVTSTDSPRFSESEFGTFEGSLIEAAAIMLATHAHNSDLLQEKDVLLVGTVRAMIDALDARDEYTCGHSERVGLIAKRLAEEYGLDHCECDRIYMTGLLHDIGKIGVPDSVLLKKAPLTDEEFEIVKKHPEIGYGILKHLEQLSYALPGVLHHHEAFDGGGYPHQLAAENIPLSARILAVADAFDAMTSVRPYRSSISVDKAASVIRQNAGKQWDVNVVNAFFRSVDYIFSVCRTSQTRSELLLDPDGKILDEARISEEDSITLAVTGSRD